MFLEPTPAFYEKKMDEEPKEERSFKFLFGYIKQYRKYFGQIVLGCSWEVFCNSFFEIGRPTEKWT
ncbi:MAG: ABC transporter, partial [Prevotella nigrescens]